MLNTWVFSSISHSIGKCSEIHRIGKLIPISFPKNMGTFIPSDSHLMVHFTIWEIHGFSHQFLIARENAAKSTREFSASFSTVLLFLLVPISGDSLKEQTEKTDKVNSLFLKRKINPGTLEFKAKYIKRRRGQGRNFIKKEGYKYILSKSMPPYTNLSSFEIISSKNYVSYPNILMKSAVAVVFGRKVSQGSSFKKDSEFNSNFLLPRDVVVAILHKLFPLMLWNCHTKFALYIKLPLFSKTKLYYSFFIREKKNNFQSFLFWEYVNLDYIHWM